MLTEGSLCSGYNGLGRAVEATLGTHLAWYAENDPHPAAVMGHRYRTAPNLGDLTALSWHDVPTVDVLTAGYPCQPFSHAGQRKGTDDDRHLWPHIADGVGVLRPSLVVLENVFGHLSLGLDVVISDLAAMGYVGRYGVVRASDVGACHQRARVFVVAYPADSAGERGDEQRGYGDNSRPPRIVAIPPQVGGSNIPPADPNRMARQEGYSLSGGCGPLDRPRTVERTERFHRPSAPDADHLGLQGKRGEPDHHGQPRDDTDRRDDSRLQAWGEYAPAIVRHERVLGRDSPPPVDGDGRLSPRFVEWMMMLPEGWVTDVVTNRAAALKCLGNGVVPACAELALRTLLR